MSGDWLSWLQQIINDLLSQKSNVFLTLAANLIMGFGVIRLVMIGINWMFTGHVDFLHLIREIIVIGAAQAMLRGYTTPATIWGNESFPAMIQKGPLELARAIGGDSFDQLDKAFNTYTENNPPPIATVIVNGIQYWLLRILIEATRFAMFFAMSWGFIVQGVCILVGPVFIPFLLFDPLSWMFWGWLRCFLQYSFYPVIGAALVHVLATLLIRIWTSPLGPGYPGGSADLAIIPFLLLAIIAVLSGPGLVAQIFSGSSGGGTGGGLLVAGATKLLSKGAA